MKWRRPAGCGAPILCIALAVSADNTTPPATGAGGNMNGLGVAIALAMPGTARPASEVFAQSLYRVHEVLVPLRGRLVPLHRGRVRGNIAGRNA